MTFQLLRRTVPGRSACRNRLLLYALILWALLPGSSVTLSATSAGAHSLKRADATGVVSTHWGPSNLGFPFQVVKTTSIYPVTVTFDNFSNVAVGIHSITITGDFTQTNTCGASVPESTVCFIYVTFTPQAAGFRTGTLTLTDNVGDTYSTSLIGNAVEAGSGATLSGIFSTGIAPYSLISYVVSPFTKGFPSGPVNYLDTSNGNATIGTATLGQPTAGLAIANGPSQATGQEPSGVATGDFNGDGKADLAVLNNGGAPCSENGTVSIWLGNGDGTFTTMPEIPLGYCPNMIAAGDFNGDGKTDLAIAGDGLGITILLANGDGTFQNTSMVVSSATGLVAAGDVNGDGIADIVTIDSVSGQTTLRYFYFNSKGNNFDSAYVSGALPSDLHGLVVADFDGDGTQDIVVAGGDWQGPELDVVTFRGAGKGSFQSPATSRVVGAFYYGLGSRTVAAGDFSGDGKADLVIAGQTTDGTNSVDAFQVLLSNGDGTFNPESPLPFVENPGSSIYSSDSVSVVTADFNGDGKTDFAMVDDYLVKVYLSNGDGSFSDEVDQDSGAESVPDYLSLAAGDFNGDGVPDLVAVDSDVDLATLSIIQKIHVATANLTNAMIPGSGIHNIESSYGGDGTFGPSISATIPLTASLVPTRLSLNASLSTANLGTQVVLTATLSPSSVGSIVTNTENVTFLDNGTSIGTGTLSSGVATLNVSSLPAGTDTITATYAGDANFAASTATSVSVVVNPVAAATVSPSSLTFSAQAAGSTSASQAVTLGNGGTAPLSITSIAASGDFAETNNCGSAVAPGATCTIAVTFTPKAGGSRTGALTITDSDAGSPQTVSLTGIGSAVTLSSSVPSLSIGSAGGSATATIQLSSAGGFSGTVELSCQVSYQGAGTPANPPVCSLSPTQVNLVGSPATTTLTVATTPPASAQLKKGFLGFGAGGTTLAALFLLIGVPRRQFRGMLSLAVLCILLGAGALVGCGGSSTPKSSPNPGTTAGSYSVTVKATSGTETATVAIPVSVQ